MDLRKMLRLLDSSSEKSWCEALFEVALSLGAEAVLFATSTPSKNATIDNWFFQTNSQKWRMHYAAHKMRRTDPTVHHCMISALPLVWGQGTCSGHDGASMDGWSSHFGMPTGVTFPMHGCDGEVGLISFSTNTLPRKQFNLSMMQSMADLSLVRDFALESSLKFSSARVHPQPIPELTRLNLKCSGG
jgi:LuxR family quorum-sensing transcriptional regulator LasR